MTDATPRRPMSAMRRLAVFEAARGICHLCDQRIKVGEKWEAEHRIPLALGGRDDETNLAPAHVACHAVKSKKDAGNLAKVLRMKAKHLGIRGGRGFQTKFRRKVSGETVLR